MNEGARIAGRFNMDLGVAHFRKPPCTAHNRQSYLCHTRHMSRGALNSGCAHLCGRVEKTQT